MMTTTVRAQLVMGLATVAGVAVAGPRTAQAAGVVGSGTAASCTDARLDTALSGGGLVTFNCGSGAVTIDISSGTGTKVITADTTIDGGGVMTISGGNSVGVFSLNSGVKFTVQNLTIANGVRTGPDDAGGAIDTGDTSGGTLTVTNSTFSGNSAGGEGDGGAINNRGTLTVTNSTFSGNSVPGGNGGAIKNNGTLTVTNSTFSGNSAPGGNPGNPGGNGSAIFNGHGGMLTVTNSTFSGNSGSAAIENGTDTVTVITNTIVANSTSGGNCAGSVTDGGHNIDNGTTCGFSTANASLNSTDPQLDPAGLQNNGGATQTIALLPSSPAIDAGDGSVCAAPPVNHLDQRGFVRPGAGHSHCSIGAFEFYSVGNPTPTPTPIPVPCVGDCDGTGNVTVNEIITLVNIALGNAEASACVHGVPSGAEVDVTLIIQAVNNALNECPA